MSSVYCQIKLELTPHLMQAAKLEAARRNLTIEEMIMKYLAAFLPENIEQALLECQHPAEERVQFLKAGGSYPKRVK